MNKGIIGLFVFIFVFSISVITTREIAYGETKNSLTTISDLSTFDTTEIDITGELSEIPFKSIEITSQSSTSTTVYATEKSTTNTTQIKLTAMSEVTPSSSTSKKPSSYTEDELYMLSHLIYAEAGGEGDTHQRYVGSVVLNRMKHPDYPNTMKGVIFQKGQYSCTWNGHYEKTPSKQAIENAKYVLTYGSVLPANVIYQAQFRQGSGVYKQMGNTYFCYA